MVSHCERRNLASTLYVSAPFETLYKSIVLNGASFIVQELCESRGDVLAVRPNEPSGFRGRKDY